MNESGPRPLARHEAFYRWLLRRQQPRWNRKPVHVDPRTGLATYPAAILADPRLADTPGDAA